MTNPRLRDCFAMGLAFLTLAGGCSSGPQRSSITGRVTLDGEPLEKGAIVFQPDKQTKSPSSGGDIVNGTYHVLQAKGPMAGVFRVEISALRKSGRKIPAGSPAPPGTLVDEYVDAIPAKYMGESSTLTAEINAGNNVHDFALTSK